MKRRTRRPEPTRVTPYFFQQLGASLSPDSSTGDEAPGAQLVAPVTRVKPMDAALWRHYTPEAYRDAFLHFVGEENTTTASLEEQVAQMWAKVEDVIARNKVRRELLQDDHLEPLLQDMGRMSFWTAEDIFKCFDFDVSMSVGDQNTEPLVTSLSPGDTDTKDAQERQQIAQGARITLDFSVDMVGAAAGGGAPDDGDGERAAGPQTGMHHAHAWRTSDADLLNPSKRPHCLRRLFAPLLQKRDQLPKSLTLLLADVQIVQSTQLPALEESIERGIFFNIPLYIPFQLISTCITRYLTQENPTAEMEVDQLRAFGPVREAVQRLESYVAEKTAQMKEKGEEVSLEQCCEVAEGMWGLLFDELETHKRVHRMAMDGYDAMTECASITEASLTTSVDTCDEISRQSLAQLQSDASLCADTITEVGQQVLRIAEDTGREYETNQARLRQSIHSKAVYLQKSEARQEKLARRVREAMKDLYQEQLTYEETTQEYLQDRLTLAQLEASHAQLRQFIQSRHDAAVNAEHHAAEVRRLLTDAVSSRTNLMVACRQHLGRMQTESFYRRNRIMTRIVDNAKQWSRCVHDVCHIYESRYSELEDKTNLSWQLEYLVAGERNQAVNNLTDLRPELMHVQEAWASIVTTLQSLEIDVPSPAEQVAQRDTAFRAALVQLDGPPKVQRKTTTLRQHRGIMDKAATGHGAAAAYSLKDGPCPATSRTR